MTGEQKELLIWGGGALLVIIILAWFTSGYATELQRHNAGIDRNYPSYASHYAEGPRRIPLAQAQQRINQAQEEQAAVRERVESVVLSPLDSRVLRSVRQGSGRPGFSYNQVVDEVDSRYRSLRSKATRLNIGTLPSLPHEGSDRIARGDEEAIEQQRSLQLAQVMLASDFLNHLVDLGVHSVRQVEAPPAVTDHREDPTYVGIDIKVTTVLDYTNLDRLMRELREPSSRWSLVEFTMTPDPQLETRFQTELTIRQVAQWPEGWTVGDIIPRAASSSSSPSGGDTPTGRGRTGGRR